MARDDDPLPTKKTSSAAKGEIAIPSSKSRTGVSPQMRRLMRFTRVMGVFLGGFVSLVGMMSLVGVVTENFWVRLVLALVLVLGFPAFVSDRLLRRTKVGGASARVADVFAILLLGLALVLVAADVVSKPLLAREGDRYARSGSRTMARVVYFLAGVSPVFPDEGKGAAPRSSGSLPGPGSASASASAPTGVTSASK